MRVVMVAGIQSDDPRTRIIPSDLRRPQTVQQSLPFYTHHSYPSIR